MVASEFADFADAIESKLVAVPLAIVVANVSAVSQVAVEIDFEMSFHINWAWKPVVAAARTKPWPEGAR